jgi:hypothetical protein
MAKWLIASIAVALGLFPFSQVTAQNGNAAVAEKSQQAVVQAVEDEIYDWGCQSHVEFVGKEVAHEKYELPVYINPQIKNGRGEIIYKFMPIGEIYRSFSMGKSGTAYLWDDPWLGFGPERPSYNTLLHGRSRSLPIQEHLAKSDLRYSAPSRRTPNSGSDRAPEEKAR